MAPPTMMPWERRAEEPEEAHVRFRLYLSLGPRRSLAEAAQQCGLSLGRLKQLSAQWQWAARAAMWDRHEFLERRRQELESRQQARERILRESADWQRLARAEFSSWVRRGPQGELELTRELSPYQALRLWRVGCEAELVLRGEMGEGPGEPQASGAQDTVARLRAGAREAARAMLPSWADYRLREQVETALRRVLGAWIHYMVEAGRLPQRADPGGLLWPWDLPYTAA